MLAPSMSFTFALPCISQMVSLFTAMRPGPTFVYSSECHFWTGWWCIKVFNFKQVVSMALNLRCRAVQVSAHHLLCCTVLLFFVSVVGKGDFARFDGLIERDSRCSITKADLKLMTLPSLIPSCVLMNRGKSNSKCYSNYILHTK